jgi:hypothetical protein
MVPEDYIGEQRHPEGLKTSKNEEKRTSRAWIFSVLKKELTRRTSKGEEENSEVKFVITKSVGSEGIKKGY